VDRIRVIAMYQMKNRHDPKSYLECPHIIREEMLEQERTNFAAVSWGALAKMDNPLMRDASSKKPVWTGEEREAVNVVIREFRLMLVLSKWAMTSAAIGFGTIIWKLCQWDSGRWHIWASIDRRDDGHIDPSPLFKTGFKSWDGLVLSRHWHQAPTWNIQYQ